MKRRTDDLSSGERMFRLETWRVAINALKANKLRAFLTMLGVVIGSACIVLVITVSLTGTKYIIGQIEGVGANIIYADLLRSSAHPTTISDEISLADLQAVKAQIPQVVAVAGVHEIPMSVDIGGVARAVNVVGVTQDYAAVRSLVMLRGRYFDSIDMESRAKNCIVNENLAQLAYPGEDPVGRTIRFAELEYTIVGMFRERVSTFGESEIQRYTALVPFTIVQYFTGNEIVGTLYATADQPADVPLVTQEIGEVLRSRHRPGAEYQVANLSSVLNAVREIARALSIVLLIIAGIALLISGIGIMNIMLVTVTERTREIGVRKAVGARQREILGQFLLEALIISGIGALLGVAGALAIAAIGRALLPAGLSVPVPWISVVLAIGVSCVTGLLFGYLPANRAARLQPTDSLRYE
ncbi:MAG TPA: ABC transporter permease [Candidatus Acidoferrum sp.]|nr:ABC transporter permease [Candidatus Acidoferrum sp.]